MTVNLNDDSVKAYNQQFCETVRLFASAEVLANSAYLLYSSTEPLTTFTLLELDGSWSDYQVHPLEIEVAGLEAYVLTSKQGGLPEIKVVFRGTYDMASVLRDFEVSSPGADSFASEKDSLLYQVETIAYEQFDLEVDTVHITVCGHSLGASDAENFAAALTHEKAQGSVDWLDSLSLYSLNSPGIAKDVAEQSVTDLTLIQDIDPNFEVDVHYGKAFYDAIQQLGDSHFLANIDPALAYIEVLEINKNYYQQTFENFFGLSYLESIFYVFDVVQAHALQTFFSPNEKGLIVDHQYQYHLYTNDTPEGDEVVQHELSDKAFSLLEVVRYSITSVQSVSGWVQDHTPELNVQDNLKSGAQAVILTLQDVLDYGSNWFSSSSIEASNESCTQDPLLPPALDLHPSLEMTPDVLF